MALFGFNKQKVLATAEKYVQQAKLQNAISEYDKILKNDPKDLTVTNTVGDLHVLAKTYQGRLLHTIRLADGSWPYPFGNVDEVTSSNIGENYGAFACATNAAGDLHVITTDFPQGRIRHTIRLANGSWPYPFQLLPLPNIGQLRSVACATNSAGDLHILAELEEPAKIWHTIRRADGSWPYPFGDVEIGRAHV